MVHMVNARDMLIRTPQPSVDPSDGMVSIFLAANNPLRAKSGDLCFQLPAWKRSSVHHGPKLNLNSSWMWSVHIHLILTYLRLCMHHHISFRPRLVIVHSDIAGLQREVTLTIGQPFCFSSIAAIISSI